MDKHVVVDHDPDTSSGRREDRELEIQNWNRERALELSKSEGLTLTDAHWEVIDFLRTRYLEQGDPESAREVAEDLREAFADRGGEKQLRRLFPGGPVTQGSRIAGLPVPAYSVDTSFGTTY
ncbi:MAG: TusE/DsrC/DsvC family sulfur relay protein [Gammaproteobacteria bacterium]|jgi:tRNA 2-thiouridine synthesizing protein E